MIRIACLCITLSLALPLLPAQLLSGTVAPTVIQPNGMVTITVSDTFGLGLQLPSSCAINAIYQGGPNGALVPTGIFCGSAITPIPACGSGTVSQTWGPSFAGITLSPGTYWIEVRFWDSGFSTLRSEYFCFAVDGTPPMIPLLSQVTPAVIGTNWTLGLSSPPDPGAAYFMAASATTNVGIPPANPVFCLDQDAIFALSFPNPLPGVFNNFQGNLDAAGGANNISLSLPNFPPLICLRLNVQGLVLGSPVGPVPVKPTSTLSAVIQ